MPRLQWGYTPTGSCEDHLEYDAHEYSALPQAEVCELWAERWPTLGDYEADMQTWGTGYSLPQGLASSESFVGYWCGMSCGVEHCSACVDRDIGLGDNPGWLSRHVTRAPCTGRWRQPSPRGGAL